MDIICSDVEFVFFFLIAISKTKGKKVELKKKSKRKVEETNSSPADLGGKMQKKRKAKGGNVDISELSQITSEGKEFSCAD